MDERKAFDELIYLQTDLLTVTIKGAASHPSFPGVGFQDKESSVRISCDDPYEISIAGDAETVSLQNIGNASFGVYKMRPLFFEQQRYEIIIEPVAGHAVEFWHDNLNVRKSVTPVGHRSAMLSGVINFGNEIGMADLVVLIDGKSYLKLSIEVFPSKISYKDDYKAIVADVTAEVYNLVFDFLKKTYDSFDISSEKHSSPVEFFAIIRKIYEEFLSAADMVIVKPHHVLETEHIVLPSHKIKRTDEKTISWIEKHPEQVLRSGDRVLVSKALAVKKYVTYNTKENQLTKYMLQSTVKRLENFRKQYLKLYRDTDLAVIEQIDAMIKGIQRRYNTGFLKDVPAAPAKSGMSLVFNMALGYRDLYRCYLLLQHGLSVTGSVFNVSVKDLAVLYEYWCFIKLNSLMKDRYELISQDIIRIAGNGLFVSLIKGQRSRVKYRNRDNGEIITLSYNPKEISGATVPQKPDNVLSLKKKGAKVDYEYVFDAKYKINPALDGSLYQTMYRTPGPQEEDINTMHRYRDAIVYQSSASPFERTMFGAYVLFPYRNQDKYRNHRFYQSIEQVNIGGLPFLPSATDLVTEMLDALISDSPESAFERATLPAGIEERLVKVDWSKREVLVGFVNGPDQLQRCLQNKYYYTYRPNISKDHLPIHYVALYQKKNGIEYYGKVLTTQLVRRDELPGKARNPQDMCYKFDVEEWIALPTPIRPELYGPNPVSYTNYFLLTHSTKYPELHLRSEAEYRFFTELKHRSDKASIDETSSKPGFELNETKVLFDEGMIQLYQNGKVVGQCTIQEFSQYPSATFRRLQRYVSEKTSPAQNESEPQF